MERGVKGMKNRKYVVMMANKIEKIDPPPFPWKGNSEHDFHKLLADSQDFFKKFKLNPNPEKWRNFMIDTKANAYTIYLDQNPVQIRKSQNGKYQFSGIDGHHRLFVAQTYNMLILAEID